MASVDEDSQARYRSRAEQRTLHDAESIKANNLGVDSQIVRKETLAERLARLDDVDRQRQKRLDL